ncbi:hypothetical protein [Chamaesiphon polymorphus]|nr:hypothetical protein [Chamaesiphon polymorphus]
MLQIRLDRFTWIFYGIQASVIDKEVVNIHTQLSIGGWVFLGDRSPSPTV